MNSHQIQLSQCAFLLAWFCPAALPAQPATPARNPAPLGLLRLQDTVKPGQAPALAAARFAVDDLSTGSTAGVSKSRKDDVDVLTVDSDREWSRPLRGSPRDVSFVSFQLYASASTIVDIAGVRLGITASPAGGNLQLMYDDSTTGTSSESLNFTSAPAPMAGKTASLPAHRAPDPARARGTFSPAAGCSRTICR